MAYLDGEEVHATWQAALRGRRPGHPMTRRPHRPDPSPKPQSRLGKAPNGATYDVLITAAPSNFAGCEIKAIVTFVDLDDALHQIVRRAPEGLVLADLTDDELADLFLGSKKKE